MRGCGEWAFHRYSLTFLAVTICRRSFGALMLCALEVGLHRVSHHVCLILMHQHR
jgi:hypothetical protein